MLPFFECSSVWWKHQPSLVLDSEQRMIFGINLFSDFTVATNRPDIIVFYDKRNKHTVHY